MKNVVWSLLLIVNAFTSLRGQTPDLFHSDAKMSIVQKSSIGKLFFTEKRCATDSLKTTDFLTQYTLSNLSNLYFIAFFDNSMGNYAHRMDPNLPADSILKNGNYQFSLFVDGKEIYTSNLLPGAPSVNQLKTGIILNRPLIDNLSGNGSWSESFWNRFFYHGGEKVLTDGRHRLRMEIRAYVNSKKILISPLMASGELELNVVLHPFIDISGIKLRKPIPYPGLAVSTEYFDSLKIKTLKGEIDAGCFKKINGMIVLKKGKILIEEYFNGENRSTLHDPRSVGKSFASTITGIAIHDGFIKNENQPLTNFYRLDSFKNCTTFKKNIVLKDLLTMSSAFDGNDEENDSPGNEENMYPTDDWVKFALDLPTKEENSTKWHYFTAGVVVLGDILNKSVNEGLEIYADKKLFRPLGIVNYQWEYTPTKVPNTAGGIRMTAPDFAKYGQLYLNNGEWEGHQIIDSSWVHKTFTRQLPIQNRKNEFYGYLFWNKTFTVGRKKCEAYYCAGNGGNYILVFKELQLVIVITSSAYGQPYAHPQVSKMLSEYILPAVINVDHQ